MDITDLLTAAVEAGASDLHLKSGNNPMMRVHGELRPIVEDCRLSPTAMDALAAELLPAASGARARGGGRHGLVCAGAPQRGAPGPGRHPGRRDARPRDVDRAHTRRDRDDQPADRRVSATPAPPDPAAAGQRVTGGHLTTAHARIDGTGRNAAVEVLVSTPFVRDCIVDPDRTHLIQGAIAAGTSQYGMQTFDQSIYGLYQGGQISYDTALQAASSPDEFKLRVQGVTSTTETALDEMAHTRPDGEGEPVAVTRFNE